MYDDEEQFEELEEELTEEEKQSNATKKLGQTATRATADYLTAGAYEKVRNAPAVGTMAQKGEEIVGNKLERQDRLSGGKIGKNAQRLDNDGILDATNNSMGIGSNQGQSLTSSNATSNIKNNSSKSENTSTSSTGLNSNSPSTLTKLPIKKPKIALLIISSFLIVLFVFIMMIAIISNNNLDSRGLAINGYYEIPCEEVTVIMTKKNVTENGTEYEITGTATYPLEEYVAGVVVGEVAYLGSYEVDKAFAVAARTFFAAYAEGNGCTIESSDRYQVFSESKNADATKAAEETKGQVLLSDGKLFTSIQYDAFACIAEDDNYYTISQANQRVPKEWIDSRINKNSLPDWFICNGKENLRNHHGNGMSQYGALYLANEQKYDYTQLLKYYLGDGITISSYGFMASIPGLEIKKTTNAKPLTVSLKEFLPTQGTSVEELNAFIRKNVEQNGAGTRAGVVTAAVSLINYLYAMDVSIPYYWGGQYQNVGVNPSFGGARNASISRGGNAYYYTGLDCSGFVSWAIRNGGYTLKRLTTQGFHNQFSGDSCNVRDPNCIGQPGDLINSKSCHVQMIVSVDEESGKYFIAEANGIAVVMQQQGIHSGNCTSDETLIIHMDKYYNNPANVDTNY